MDGFGFPLFFEFLFDENGVFVNRFYLFLIVLRDEVLEHPAGHVEVEEEFLNFAVLAPAVADTENGFSRG